MQIEQKLYTPAEVGQIIKSAISELVGKLDASEKKDSAQQETIMRQWAQELLPSVESTVAEEVVRRHVQGIKLAVWAGPPGSGKGTNIDTASLLGKVYAEVVSQGGAEHLEEPFHSMLLSFSIAQAMISTGTKGMFNKPEGEYADLFNGALPVIANLVAGGGFVPDDMVSVLVELMILYRLTQNAHNIQIDLWPRTPAQFEAFVHFVDAIKTKGGKVTQEIVTIKVLNDEDLAVVLKAPGMCAEESKAVAKTLLQAMKEDWYQEALAKTVTLTDPKEKFAYEESILKQGLALLKEKHTSEIAITVINELETVCNRMAFRFNTALAAGIAIRPDEYPLSVVKRLSIYTAETAPAFLSAFEKYDKEGGFFVVSSFKTPQEVIAGVLDTLAGTATTDPRWQKIKEVAGEIAYAITYRKELIVSELVERVGGIINTEIQR